MCVQFQRCVLLHSDALKWVPCQICRGWLQKCVGTYGIYQWWLLIQLRLIQHCICGYQYKENTICVDEELGHIISEVPSITSHFRSLLFQHPHFGRPSLGWSDPTCTQVVCDTIDPLFWFTTTQKHPLSCPASLCLSAPAALNQLLVLCFLMLERLFNVIFPEKMSIDGVNDTTDMVEPMVIPCSPVQMWLSQRGILSWSWSRT